MRKEMPTRATFLSSLERGGRVGRKYLLYPVLLLALLLLLPPQSPLAAKEHADNYRIVVVTSDGSKVYRQVIDYIESELLSHCDTSVAVCPEIASVVMVSNDADSISQQRLIQASPDIIVTLGTKAAQLVAVLKLTTPTLYTLIPKSTYQALPSCCLPNASAIFLDQPIKRQFGLIKAALPNTGKIGLLLGPTSSQQQPQLEKAAAAAGMRLRIETVAKREEVGVTLKRVLKDVDLLLALPDPVVYSRLTVFNVLLSSYHNGIPVIGFSKSYVNAGALLALYSTPQQIGHQVAELMEVFFNGDKQQLPAAQYPRYFSVASNQNVALSLKIYLPNTKALESALTEVTE